MKSKKGGREAAFFNAGAIKLQIGFNQQGAPVFRRRLK